MQIDHIVTQLAPSETDRIKAEMDARGLPFEPDWGKRAKGFHVSNIWIGEQYFELVTITAPDNLWQPEWVERFVRGERGTCCLFIRLEGDLEGAQRALSAAGLNPGPIQRTSFRFFFNLLQKRMPWRFFLCPKLPGTDIELGFIQYDDGALARFRRYMVPNAEEQGLNGLSHAVLASHEPDAANALLERAGAALKGQLPVAAEPATGGHALRLSAHADAARAGLAFTVFDAQVQA